MELGGGNSNSRVSFLFGLIFCVCSLFNVSNCTFGIVWKFLQGP